MTFLLETIKSRKTAEKVIQKLTISVEKNRTYTLEKSVTVAKYQMGEQTTTSKLALLSLPRFKEMYAESKEACANYGRMQPLPLMGISCHKKC